MCVGSTPTSATVLFFDGVRCVAEFARGSVTAEVRVRLPSDTLENDEARISKSASITPFVIGHASFFRHWVFRHSSFGDQS